MENITIANSRAGARCLIAKAPGAARERCGVRATGSVRGDGGLRRYRICLPTPVG